MGDIVLTYLQDSYLEVNLDSFTTPYSSIYHSLPASQPPLYFHNFQ